MIKLDINKIDNLFLLEHDMFCKEEIVDELTMALDIIIADYEIKSLPVINKLSTEEREKLLISKRAEYLDLMLKKA